MTAAALPCTTRAAMSSQSEGVSPHAADAAADAD
jgi:hypothetical protein